MKLILLLKYSNLLIKSCISARPTFLNLSLNLNSLRLQQPNGTTKRMWFNIQIGFIFGFFSIYLFIIIVALFISFL